LKTLNDVAAEKWDHNYDSLRSLKLEYDDFISNESTYERHHESFGENEVATTRNANFRRRYLRNKPLHLDIIQHTDT